MGEAISIGQAAELAGWSPYYFCRRFKQVTGRTFVEYVNMQRMNEAEKLLRSSTLTLERIAENVGLGNAGYLTKLFKKYKGCPPSRYNK